ncbi:SDR family oxidoreductase [Neobacillus notoginsengisoli]|uniref:SDR family oxidoreductase n=1 Tax=Neobacillus notoginsengisoli TaxID=1578198 RepID=A0A417YV28_9BACI|nr:SDR family oxidoreductase [Neobacillus notoginsengisoli]RHW41156.1 SDR family oxidoreductase [Neobacillus notoginsengisoli]
MENLSGKNVVITGASGGIGAEIAKLAAARGANLALLARSRDKLEKLKAKLESSYSSKILIYKLDVSETDNVSATFARVYHELGEIDLLVNNAGFGIFRHAHEADIEEIKAMFDVNVIGLIACTSAVLPKMRARRSGHIINIASQAGKIATPKSSVYSATKHAVLGYTNSLRMELSDYNVYVTSVNPGPIATNFFNIADESGSYVKNVKRWMLKPEYVAEKVVGSMLKPVREVNLPGWMNAGSIFYALFPRMFERLGKKAFNQK